MSEMGRSPPGCFDAIGVVCGHSGRQARLPNYKLISAPVILELRPVAKIAGWLEAYVYARAFAPTGPKMNYLLAALNARVLIDNIQPRFDTPIAEAIVYQPRESMRKF